MIDLVNKLLASPDLLLAHGLIFLLILTRWLTITIIFPILGANLIPRLVRVGLAILLTIFVCFVLGDQTQQILPLPNKFIIICYFFKEALIGLILGLLASLIFYLYELIGRLIDFSRAASMAQLLVPELKTQSSALGSFLFQLSLVLFISLGLHRKFIKNLILSFDYLPVYKFSPDKFSQNNFAFVLIILAQILKLAFTLALPTIFVCFLIDFSFGLLNRAAPQVNAYFLSLPAKIIGGLAILFFIMPFLLDDFVIHVDKISEFFYVFNTSK